MASTDSVMSARLAGELDHAFARTGWTPNEVKDLTSGDTLAEYLAVRRGTHRIVEVEKPPAPPLFRYLDTVKIAAIPSFNVPAHFKVGETDGVKVGYVWNFFTSCFGSLVEDAQPALALRRNESTRTSSCNAINEALGKGIEEATCGQIWALMKRQGRGQRGKLHVDGKANIFRVRDKNGVLRLVNVSWSADDGDWRVDVDELGDALGWRAGRLVFSRNS